MNEKLEILSRLCSIEKLSMDLRKSTKNDVCKMCTKCKRNKQRNELVRVVVKKYRPENLRKIKQKHINYPYTINKDNLARLI